METPICSGRGLLLIQFHQCRDASLGGHTILPLLSRARQFILRSFNSYFGDWFTPFAFGKGEPIYEGFPYSRAFRLASSVHDGNVQTRYQLQYCPSKSPKAAYHSGGSGTTRARARSSRSCIVGAQNQPEIPRPLTVCASGIYTMRLAQAQRSIRKCQLPGKFVYLFGLMQDARCEGCWNVMCSLIINKTLFLYFQKRSRLLMKRDCCRGLSDRTDVEAGVSRGKEGEDVEATRDRTIESRE